MKETLAKLRTHMNDKAVSHKSIVESKKPHIDSTKQAKKDKILSLVKQTELEYQAKTLSTEVAHKIHAKFEQMKDDLAHVSDIHLLKTKLQSTLGAIKSLEQAELEQKNEFEEEDDDLVAEKETKKVDNDFEAEEEDEEDEGAEW